jgi:hypothetical protein
MRISFLILVIVSFFSLVSYSQVDISVDCQNIWGPGRYNKVTIRINKGNTKGFARFCQEFPVGFEIIKDKAGEADFNWVNDQLDIVWIRLPEDPMITFSYFAKPDKSMDGDFSLSGKYICITGGDTRVTTTLPQKLIVIGGNNGLQAEEMKAITGTSDDVKMVSKPSFTSSGQKNIVEFRIQVLISSSDISAKELKRRVGLDSKENVIVVRSGKMYKYQIGSFSDYEAANTFLKQLTSKGIKDAFVVAYKGKGQITIKEALKPMK